MSTRSTSPARKLRDLTETIRPEDEDGILERAKAKLGSRTAIHAASTLLRNVGTLYRMMTDQRFSMQWSTRAMILGALVYFILPTDATPDFIPVVGYFDDTLIVGWVIKRLAREIDRYRHQIAH